MIDLFVVILVDTTAVVPQVSSKNQDDFSDAIVACKPKLLAKFDQIETGQIRASRNLISKEDFAMCLDHVT